MRVFTVEATWCGVKGAFNYFLVDVGLFHSKKESFWNTKPNQERTPLCLSYYYTNISPRGNLDTLDYDRQIQE